MNPIDLQKLVNFDDTTPIDKLIERIEKLNGVYDTLVSDAEAKSAKYAQALNNILAAAEKLEDQMLSLDATEQAQQETIAKGAAQADKLVKDNEEYTKSLKEVEQQVLILTEQQKKLASAKDKLNSSNVAEKGSLTQLKAELKAATDEYSKMGDATAQAVKDEHLKKINELAKQVNTVDKALKAAKTGTITAAKSYNELAQRVAESKKRLKEMEGGIGSSSKEFKALQKEIKIGSDKLKEFDSALGDNQRNVGNYSDALSGLPGPLQAVVGGIQSVTRAGLAFIATPIGAIIGAIALALGALTAYFKSSVEGQDDLNKVLAIGNAIFQTLLDAVEFLGKALFKWLSEPKKIMDQLNSALKTVGDALSAFFNDPIKYIKEFGRLIVDNIIKRFEAVGIAAQGLMKIFKGQFSEGFKDLGDAAIQGTTGIEDGVDKIADAADAAIKEIDALSSAAAAEFEKRIKLANKIADLENKIRKDKIADIVDDAKTELEVNKLILESKDKLRVEDQKRLDAVRKANQKLEDQLKGDLQLIRDEIALQELVIQQDGDTYEAREKLAQLQVQEINLQSAFFQAAKRRQSLELAIIREIQKEREDAIKRERESEFNLNKAILDAEVKTNDEIIADERSTNDEIINAITDRADALDDLALKERDRALEAAQETALARIELDGVTNDKIFNDRSLSIDQQLQLERDAKLLLLQEDKTYNDERQRIALQYNNTIEDITKKSAELVQNNAFKQLQKDFNNLNDTVKAKASETSIAIDEAYKAGTLNLAGVARERRELEEKAITDSLNAQLDYLTKQKDELKKWGKDVTQIEAQIAKTREEISAASTDKLIADQQRFRQAVEDIGFQIAATATDFFNAQIERNVQALDSQMQAEEDKAARSLQLVGDDAQAKAYIEQELARKQEIIRKQIARERRKQAIFERGVALAEIVYNTAKGISAAVGESPITFGLPWSAFVALTGALQAASVLAAPLPSFFRGTEFSPEGWANVAERGPEAIISPSGDVSIAQEKQVRYLERGSKVLTAERTESLMKDAERFGDGYLMDQVLNSYDSGTRELHIEKGIDNSAFVIAAMDKQTRQIVTAIKTQPQDFYDEKGYRHYENTVNARILKLNKRYRLQ